MTLVDKQSDFAVCVAGLILHARNLGYQVTFGDAYRDPRVPYGHAKSCHRARLAVDLNLFVEGKYVSDSNAPQWKELGEFWETLDHRARWGGQGSKHPEGLSHDGNHFSFEHEGVQ